MTSGVAVFVAIALAGQAARSSFMSAVEAISGKATHEVVAIGGIEEGRFREFAAMPVVEAAQPVLEGRAMVRAVTRDGRRQAKSLPPLRILGVDPFFATPFLTTRPREPVVPEGGLERFLTESGTALLSNTWAAEAKVQAGDALVLVVAGRERLLRVLGLYDLSVLEEGAKDTALVDLATAQELLDRLGRLDRIELQLKAGREADIEANLGVSEVLQRPQRRGERLARMIDAFRLNLLALGGLALVVGALLVFNAAQFTVIRRDRLLGQLRTLGASRKALLAAILAETTLFGVLGGLLGLMLGGLLAHGLVRAIGGTITDLYAFVEVDIGGLSPGATVAILVGAGLIAASAGWFPALDAARAAPRMVGLRSLGEATYRLRLPLLLALGAGALVLAAVAILLPVRSWWPGLLAAFALIATGACWTPPFMGWLLPKIQQSTESWGWLLPPMATGAVHRSLSRTGGAAAGLGVALAMTVGVLIMVGSFERELDRWIDQAIQADIFVGDVSQRQARDEARVPAAAVAELRKTPGLRGIDILRAVEIPLGQRSVRFAGVDWSLPEARRFEILEGDPERAYDLALAGAVLISEPLARHHRLGVGDRLPVSGRSGPMELEIVGVFRDYSYDRGLALTGAGRFLELFGELGVRNVALYLEPGIDREETVQSLRQRLAGRYALEIRSNGELREEVTDIFHRTFAVTYLLQVIATMMALVGIAVTLFGLFLERGREMATLRSLGMELDGVRSLFALESILMALFPVLISLPLGTALAWVLTAVINLRSFGWTIRYHVPWTAVLGTFALALAAGLLATIAPMILARRQSVALALREE
jgi:putative ABC transport system permease protein